jgi:hypothetical protein
VRRVLIVSLAGLLLAACGAPHDPEVTFYADGHAVNVEPTKYCDLDITDCVEQDATGNLRVRPGKPLQVSVGGEIARSAWTVVWTWRTASGEVGGENSEVFAAGTRFAYTITLPRPDDQLESAEVQALGRRIELNESGGLDFTARGTWNLLVEPK